MVTSVFFCFVFFCVVVLPRQLTDLLPTIEGGSKEGPLGGRETRGEHFLELRGIKKGNAFFTVRFNTSCTQTTVYATLMASRPASGGRAALENGLPCPLVYPGELYINKDK